MKPYANRFYRDMEEDDNLTFVNNIFYIDTVSFIGFGARILDKNNEEEYGNIFINIAVGLDDKSSIIKLVYSFSDTKKEYKAFIDTAYAMPDRGITGFCPTFMIVSDFVKYRDEYYTYAIDARAKSKEAESIIFTFSFDILAMTKVFYIQSIVKKFLYIGNKITYTVLDKYTNLFADNEHTEIVNILFTNQYEITGFVQPQKKIFDRGDNVLCLCHFKHNRETYYIYFTRYVSKSDKKRIRHSPYPSESSLFNMMEKYSSYMILDMIPVMFYNKKAGEPNNRYILIGSRRDKNKDICFILTEENYKAFMKSVDDFMYN
jgi:hypothetical protein